MLNAQFIEQPVGCAQFAYDIYYGPKAWLSKRMNVKRWSFFESGGHFAAMEKPDVFVKDVKAFLLAQSDAARSRL